MKDKEYNIEILPIEMGEDMNKFIEERDRLIKKIPSMMGIPKERLGGDKPTMELDYYRKNIRRILGWKGTWLLNNFYLYL